MGIHLQHAKITMFFGHCPEITQRDTVVPAQYGYQFAAVKQFQGLFIYPVIEKTAPLVDFLEGFGHEIVVGHQISLGDIVDIELRLFAEVVTFHENFAVGTPHKKSLFPAIVQVVVKNVHLHAGIKYVFGSP